MTHTRWEQVGAVAGIIFAILFVASLMMIKLPGGDDTNQVVADYFTEDSRFGEHTVAAYLIAIAGLAFLVFLNAIRSRLQASTAEDSGFLSLAHSTGLLFVGMLFVAGAAAVSMSASIEIGEEAQFGADIARVGWIATVVLLIYGILAASAMIAAVSYLILRTGAFPRWLAWVGFVCAVLLLFGYIYMPMFALPIWTIVASVGLLLRPAREEARPTVRMAEPV